MRSAAGMLRRADSLPACAAQVERHGVLDVHVEHRGVELPIRQVPAALLQWTMYHYLSVSMLAFFLSMTCVLVSSFAGYHLWLTARNVTTNEAWKRKDLRAWLIETATAEAAEAAEAAAAAGGEGAAAAPASAAPPPRTGCFGRLCRRLRGRQAAPQEAPPVVLSAEVMADIDAKCRNLYDRGVLQNFLEVLFPLLQRRQARGDSGQAAAGSKKRAKKRD